MMEQLERTQLARDQRALDRGEVLVDMGLEDRPCAGAQRRHVAQHLVRRRLGDGDRKRGMDDAVASPAAEMLLGVPQDLRTIRRSRPAAAVVADEADHAAQAGFLRPAGERRDVAGSTRAGIDHRGEAAAQRFERRRLGRQIDKLLVERALERHPDAAEDLGRLAERQCLAEGLGEMMVGIDEARHQKLAGKHDRFKLRMARAHLRCRPDSAKLAVRDHDRVVSHRPLSQHHLVRHEQQRLAGELLGAKLTIRRWGLGLARERHARLTHPALAASRFLPGAPMLVVAGSRRT